MQLMYVFGVQWPAGLKLNLNILILNYLFSRLSKILQFQSLMGVYHIIVLWIVDQFYRFSTLRFINLSFCIKAKTIVAGMLVLAVASCNPKIKATDNINPSGIIDVKSLDPEPVPVQPPVTVATSTDSKSKNIQLKYAAYLRIPPDSISNIRLFTFIDYWLNTPYLWGGTTRDGIDCSAFIQRLLADVYQIRLPRTSIEQFYTRNIEPFGSRHYLREGDLVFFSTKPDREISHVGLYLGNRKFVNASSTYGVSIANMDTKYWRKYYVACGRVIVKKPKS